MLSESVDPSDQEAVSMSPSAIAIPDGDAFRLLIDSESLHQAVYLYSPVFADGTDEIVDLEIVTVNEAARHVLLSEHILEGNRVSDVFVDLGTALEAANDAWRGGRPAPYRIERRGVHDGRPMTVRYEVATMRAVDHLVQVSVDRTVVEQLAHADNRFRLMAEASIDGLMLLEPSDVADEFVVSYANPRALLSEPRLQIGSPLPANIAEVVRDAVSELRDVTPVRRYLQREVLARRVSLEATFTDMGDGQVMMTVRELTSRESARAELERSDRVLRAIGEGAFGTIAVYEPRFEGRNLVELTLLWSAAGHSHGAGQRPPLDPTTVLSASDVLRMAKAMLQSDQLTRSGWVPVMVADGDERSVEFTLVLAGDRFVLEFVERTEELHAQTQLAMVTASSEAQRAFLSRVSHEIRSPLNVIHGYAQLLGRLHLPDVANSHVGHIERGVARMVQIVDDLLLLGQLDQGLLRMDEQPVEVGDLAAELVHVASRSSWWHDGAMVAGESEAPDGAMVHTDRSRFVMAAVLLAEASVGMAGGHRIVVAPFVRGTRAGVQFLTETTSPVTEALWEPFVTSHTIPGNGLGMAVARSMAAALDVSVEVREVPGNLDHTCLVLTLPVAV